MYLIAADPDGLEKPAMIHEHTGGLKMAVCTSCNGTKTQTCPEVHVKGVECPECRSTNGAGGVVLCKTCNGTGKT